MTAVEIFVAIAAMMIALLVSMGIEVGIVAACVAWRNWQREKGFAVLDELTEAEAAQKRLVEPQTDVVLSQARAIDWKA